MAWCDRCGGVSNGHGWWEHHPLCLPVAALEARVHEAEQAIEQLTAAVEVLAGLRTESESNEGKK
jgi:hypothetical protein